MKKKEKNVYIALYKKIEILIKIFKEEIDIKILKENKYNNLNKIESKTSIRNIMKKAIINQKGVKEMKNICNNLNTNF